MDVCFDQTKRSAPNSETITQKKEVRSSIYNGLYTFTSFFLGNLTINDLEAVGPILHQISTIFAAKAAANFVFE